MPDKRLTPHIVTSNKKNIRRKKNKSDYFNEISNNKKKNNIHQFEVISSLPKSSMSIFFKQSILISFYFIDLLTSRITTITHSRKISETDSKKPAKSKPTSEVKLGKKKVETLLSKRSISKYSEQIDRGIFSLESCVIIDALS